MKIVEIPRTYLERERHARFSDSSASVKNLASQNFERLLRTVLNAGASLVHRIFVNSGNATVTYVTIPDEGRMICLIFEAHFPEFTVKFDMDSAS